MFSDDYILRIVRQATAVFARIIKLKSVEQYQEALQVIDQTLEQLLGLDVEIIRLLDDESLYTLLMKEDVLDLEKLGFIADLFKEEGNIHKLQGQIEESNNCYIRSLNYYLIVAINSETSLPIELSQKIDGLLQKLNTYSFAEQTLLNLFSYYEIGVQFAKAEDMLRRLVPPSGARAYVMDEMKSFYKRLLEKSEKDLAVGGMSRIQIQNKLKELE